MIRPITASRPSIQATLARPHTAQPRRETGFSLGGRTEAAATREHRDGLLNRLAEGLEVRRARIDAAIDRARRGAELRPAELLALQARVYAYNQQVEVVSRVVDKTVGAAKAVLNTQI